MIEKITGLDVWAGKVTPMQFGRTHDGAGEPLDHTAVVIVLPDCLEYKNVLVRVEALESDIAERAGDVGEDEDFELSGDGL